MRPVIDPRQGDIEDDVSSTKRRSLLSLAGSLLAEISLPKLVLAWLLLIVVPGIVLGLAPLIATAWIGKVWGKVADPLTGIWSFVVLALLIALGWFGAGALFRLTRNSFWSLSALAIEPGYVASREFLRHLAERAVRSRARRTQVGTLRRIAAAAAGVAVCAVALAALTLVWPYSRWIGSFADLASLHRLLPVIAANTVVLIAGYLAVAVLGWAIADAAMVQPHDLGGFHEPARDRRVWRIAHLSDIHIVGERYGFRIESGRSGPRGNGRLERALERLEAIHAADPLDLVLITGDVTDAGRSTEWAEFLDAMARHPPLAERVLLLPGNHDLNVVDRANPARLDLPIGPSRLLRQLRALSAITMLQGERVHLVDLAERRLGQSLADAMQPYRPAIAALADTGGSGMSKSLKRLWAGAFPMVVPPDAEDGLGIMLLNSNADTHFAFTNALGMIPAEQARAVAIAREQYPRACWIVALHHHLLEYPTPAKALSERIGTALINGNWFLRRLRPLADHAVLMHGHRHIDWTGDCSGLLIVSAPSVVMEAIDADATFFYVQNLQVGADGKLRLLAPERVIVAGDPGCRSAGDRGVRTLPQPVGRKTPA